VEDADYFDDLFMAQETVKNQMLGEVGHFPGAEIFRHRAVEEARASESGSAGELLERCFGAGDETVGQIRIARLVGVEIPLSAQVGPGR